MKTKHNPLIKLFWWMHLKLYLWSKGRIGGSMRGLPVLILITKGKQTGLLRTKALMYLPYGNNFVVIASNLGKENHPGWWINLMAQPNASAQIAGSQYTVRARKAQGEERENLWQALSEKSSDYEQYRSWAKRRIPIVILERQ